HSATPARGRRDYSPAQAGLGGLVQAQLARRLAVPAVFLRLEHRTAGQRLLVDVQRDCHVIGAGIADGVVFVRRDQAAGRTDAGDLGADRFEAHAVAVLFSQLELGDFQLSLPDALDAPDAGVVVYRRALPRAPGHRNDAVAGFFAAVELAAGVV